MKDRGSTATQPLYRMGVEGYEKIAPSIDWRNGTPYWNCDRPRKRAFKGDVAGSVSPRGYRTIQCRPFKVFAHRLRWFMEFGYVPYEIDHINHSPDDNRLENLREVTHSQNMRNRRGYGVSKYVGVSPSGNSGKWVASVKIRGHLFYLGTFEVEEDAAEAYDRKCVESGIFEYANLNFPEGRDV